MEPKYCRLNSDELPPWMQRVVAPNDWCLVEAERPARTELPCVCIQGRHSPINLECPHVGTVTILTSDRRHESLRVSYTLPATAVHIAP